MANITLLDAVSESNFTTPSDKLLMLIFAQLCYSNQSWSPRYNKTIQELGTLCGFTTKSTVHRSLKRLCDEGWLKVVRDPGSKSNNYVLSIPGERKAEEARPVTGEPVREPLATQPVKQTPTHQAPPAPCPVYRQRDNPPEIMIELPRPPPQKFLHQRGEREPIPLNRLLVNFMNKQKGEP